jgi:cell division protein FtsX
MTAFLIIALTLFIILSITLYAKGKDLLQQVETANHLYMNNVQRNVELRKDLYTMNENLRDKYNETRHALVVAERRLANVTEVNMNLLEELEALEQSLDDFTRPEGETPNVD